ncbi:putative heat shock protein [Ordospora colligata]|uniref:Putative heat shock protein n=1 Tax=Ordospora colligata OC4 TaxID=1354746 RepID=A0A0B2UHX7_9MICR|nr:putative heat shock protein [Ordospora colligata OC4]KHN68948.1 putative heat shock protein [Ordospora colligata OC4]TBU13982.1 putative heat shock protein [Ordospora colligata]TBU14171.1 putative heat shock protein [Ordospora colligata]TBU17840.1 putative heat shock protein [Ordospora colligata]
MEFVGIDVGNYKTLIASSKDNGKVYGDEQGKRGVRTIMELSKPIRRFGNGVTSDVSEMLERRRRSFRDELNDSKGRGDMGMFMKYLDRIIKSSTPTHPPICMTVPVYFKERQRRILSGIAHAVDFKLEEIVTDVSAIGMFACVRRENMPETFMVLDFGYSKTTAGLFKFEKNVLKPVYMNVVKTGSMQFDEKLIEIVIKKNALEGNALTIEKVRRNLDKIKTTLNSTESCSLHIFITDNAIDVVVTQEEYRQAVAEDVNELKKFVTRVIEDTKHEGAVEVTGGNVNSFVVKEMLEGLVGYQATLDVSESSAIGSALGMACRSFKTKFSLNEIVGREICVKMQNENVKPTVVFKADDIIGGNAKMVTYYRKERFDLEVIEDGEVISVLRIEKGDSEEAEAVNVSLAISKLGTVCVTAVNVTKTGSGTEPIQYKYECFALSDEEMNEIKALEEEYRDCELGIEKVGAMRNELETMAIGLGDALESKFSNVFNEEEINRVKEIAMDLFDITLPDTVKEEEKIRKDLLSKLEFVSAKFDECRKIVVNDLEKGRDMVNEFKSENPKMFTPSFYKLQGLLYKAEECLKTFSLNVFNAGSFDGTIAVSILKDIQLYMGKAKEEVELKKAEMQKNEEKCCSKDECCEDNECCEDEEDDDMKDDQADDNKESDDNN